MLCCVLILKEKIVKRGSGVGVMIIIIINEWIIKIKIRNDEGSMKGMNG